jgi:hypothetical protein
MTFDTHQEWNNKDTLASSDTRQEIKTILHNTVS